MQNRTFSIWYCSSSLLLLLSSFSSSSVLFLLGTFVVVCCFSLSLDVNFWLDLYPKMIKATRSIKSNHIHLNEYGFVGVTVSCGSFGWWRTNPVRMSLMKINIRCQSLLKSSFKARVYQHSIVCLVLVWSNAGSSLSNTVSKFLEQRMFPFTVLIRL